MLELRICGGVEVEVDGLLVPESLIGGRQGRLVLAYLGCERDRAVRREELADLLWPDQLPESWTASLSAVISRVRRLFTEAGLDGASVVVSTPAAYQLVLPPGSRVDLEDLVAAVAEAEDAAELGETERALDAAKRAEAVAARGFLADDCEWVDARRDEIRELRVRVSIAQSVAHLHAAAPARAVEAARRSVELDGSKEAGYRQLMRALAAAGERAEALRVWERCRITVTEELGVDPSPETEAVYLGLIEAAPPSAAPSAAPRELPSGVVTFLLTDIVESSALWEEHAAAMAAALERHDAIVAAVVADHGGALLKSKLEGDATVSVFARATECAVASLALLDAIDSESWPEGACPRLRVAMHTGEAFERGGDYFGPALNRAARLRSLATSNEVLLSQAVAELVRDHLPAGVVLRDRGMQSLRGLSRGEHVFELIRIATGERADAASGPAVDELTRPPVPTTLTGSGPFVGRGDELEQLTTLWQHTAAGEPGAVFVGGEPGVGKSRLAGEIAERAYADGGLVLYGRCDEDLAAPLQPFIEAVRMLAPALGATRLRAVRGIDELTRVLPELTDQLGEWPGVRADPDTERLALFDAVTQLLVAASHDVPVLLVLDDLHWAGRTTLSLLRHLMRSTKGSRLLVLGTYRDTELARSHPLAATLADLRRDVDTRRIALGGLAEADVAAYLTAIGNTDGDLGRELAEVTAGNPFFLIEVVRHVEESGGVWQPGSLPEGVREATGRRLSRLSEAANEALAVAAVAGTTFDLALVEQVRGADLVDVIAEAVQAGLVVEEPGSVARFRFAHAIVRQVLLSELVSLKRVRLHRNIAELLEAAPPSADLDARLADLAYHWFECASAGSADQAVEACRRAADRAMERLAYEEAGDLYGMALQAFEWVDGTDAEAAAALHLARCDALLTAGDVAGASAAIDALELAAAGSERLAAWYTTYEGLLAVLGEPDRLTEIVQSIGAAAGAMRDVGDLTGEAKARHVHASALERLGQIGAAERALDAALAAARSAGDQQLADAILAEAPPAALWGPSTVTRASGRCLDVVRVLRITSGAPAVESVALRCQAVLEALRGRIDAARRMIGSARRTVEQLGLTHRKLEAEFAAGLIELFDGQAAAAEDLLRAAYEGLRERGLGGEAAQAGAFLGRALLLEGRVDEADEVAAAAQALAGSDLRAAITWRTVRAEAAARRGDIDGAIVLAREAVEIASATDALLLVADARLTLAGVLRAAGDDAAAEAEGRRAVEAFETKGATVLAAQARDAIGATTAAAPERTTAAVSGPESLDDAVAALNEVTASHGFENDATCTAARYQAAFNAHNWDAMAACWADNYTLEDRRSMIRVSLDRAQMVETMQHIFGAHGRLETEIVATRGRSLVLLRTTLWVPAPEAAATVLIVSRVDEAGCYECGVTFDPDDLDGAFAELDGMFLEGEGADHADVILLVTSLLDALRDRDEDRASATLAPGFVVREHGPVAAPDLTAWEWIASLWDALELFGSLTVRVQHIMDVSSSGGLWVMVTSGEHADGGSFEISWFLVMRVANGQIASLDLYDGHDIHAARAAVGQDPRRSAEWSENDATRNLARWHAAHRAHDWDALIDTIADDLTQTDLRSLMRVALDHEASVASMRLIFDGRGDLEYDVIVTRGRSLCLSRWTIWLEEFEASDTVLSLCEVDEAGRKARQILFDPDDLDGALAELDRLYREREAREPDPEAALVAVDPAPAGNAAWHAALRLSAAQTRRDWQGIRDILDPAYVYVDHRQGIRLRLEGEDALQVHRTVLALDEVRDDRFPVAARGDRLALTRDRVSFVVGDAGPSEVEVLTLIECGADGRIVTGTGFDVDDLDAAHAALDARHAQLLGEVGDPVGNAAWRAALRLSAAEHDRDLSAIVDVLDPDVVSVDHRQSVLLRLRGEEVVESYRFAVSVDDLTDEHTLLAVRGDRLALTRELVSFVDGDAGDSEVELLALLESGDDERIVALTAFDSRDIDSAVAALDARHAELAAGIDGAAPSAVGLERFENDAWRAALRVCDAANRRDLHGTVGALDPAFVQFDRRHGVHLRLDRDDLLESFRILFTVDDFTFARTLLATRGDRLALIRTRVALVDGEAGPSEVANLSISELGPDGLIASEVVLDPDDLDAAYDTLDDRWVALDGPPLGPVIKRAFDARDWDTFASVFTPDFTIADYRTAGWGTVDRDTLVDYHRSIVELSPDAHFWIDHARQRGNVYLSAARVCGGDDAGGAWEIAFVTIGVTGPDGRSKYCETYEVSDLPRALERFDQLVAEHGASPRP